MVTGKCVDVLICLLFCQKPPYFFWKKTTDIIRDIPSTQYLAVVYCFYSPDNVTVTNTNRPNMISRVSESGTVYVLSFSLPTDWPPPFPATQTPNGRAHVPSLIRG